MTAMIRLLGAAVVLASAAPTLAAQAPDGAALYREHCKECHGAAGRPTKQALGKYKDIKPFDATFLAARSDDSLLAVLKHGAKDGKEIDRKSTRLNSSHVKI